MLNTTLLKSAQKVMNNPAPAQFFMTAKFINSDTDSKFVFYPFRINDLVIDKDFLGNFTDDIRMTMRVSPKDYALLQDQGQDLLCVITITYVDKYGKIVFDPSPIRKQYHVLVNDSQDIRKSITDVQNYTEPSLDITVQLVESTIYKLRHTKINTIYQTMTVTQAIYAITQSLGIEKIHMVSADNTHQYDHIEIASYQGIDTIYGYLHSKCGIYAKGSNIYLSDGVLYVYPPFETSPVYDKTAIFYQVDKGNFAGSHIFHQVENNTVSIVVNSVPESHDLSVAGSENIGTGFIMLRASHIKDGITGVDSKDGAMFTENPALSISLNTNRTVVSKQNNVFHAKTTDNPFVGMSQIISHQASLMDMIWMNADPFQLDPGHAVMYYYDQNEVMVHKSGIVEKALFRLAFMDKIGTNDMFGAVGRLSLRLSPNASVE